MSQDQYIKDHLEAHMRTRKKSSHLSYTERKTLEKFVRGNFVLPKKKRLSQRDMAKILGVSPATISRELRRGAVTSYDQVLRGRADYNADKGQSKYARKARNKGPGLAIAKNRKLAEKIEEQILDHYSPYCALEKLRKAPAFQKTPIRLRTLYNYIAQGLFLRITRVNLPRKGKTSKGKYMFIHRAPRLADAKDLTQRPKEANERSEFGHWEMDCIESGGRHHRCVLLNLTERASRMVLLFKMPSQKARNVVRVLDQLEMKMGEKSFRETFRSITVDNGSEFMDWQGMEASSLDKEAKQKRTAIYYCRPYHSWERGTNEQTNGVIRYFIPKGSNIADYSKEEIQKIQDRLNTMPRKLFQGASALEERHRLLQKTA